MNRVRLVLVIAIVLYGCGSDSDTPAPGNSNAQMQLITVEGDPADQWEVWRDRVTDTRILCHHSGWTGAAGGRSTSCVVVGREIPVEAH